MQSTRAFRRRDTASLAVAAIGLLAAGASFAPVAVAQEIPEPSGTIAYIEDRVRIHVIDADGTNEQVVFGLTPDATSGIESVAWRPDGGRLAFASGHEELCSIWQADLYLVDPDGTDLSRLTNGPACAELAALPSGTVQVTIQNQQSDIQEFLVHVQGLETAQAVILQPGFQSTFEIAGVHDLGADTPQFVVVSNGSSRWFDAGVFADVQPGRTTDAGVIVVGTNAFDTWGALSASWSHDGTRIAYQQGLGSLWQIPASAGQLEIGTTLFDSSVNGDISATTPTWSPVDDRVLYQRFDDSPSTVDVGRADADRVGDAVVAATLVNGLDWLPDGSGFIASDSSALLDTANLYQVELTTGAVAPITGYDTGFALWPTVSPDGLFVAYTYTAVPLDQATSAELHVRHLATGTDRVLVANGLNPDWGP